jgi:hypothetical protein
MADVIDFSAAKAGQQPVQDNEQGGRPDEDFLQDCYYTVGSLVADNLEMDLEHITQPCGRIAFEDMIACGIAALSKVLRDYPHKLFPAKGWDRGRRRTKLGTAPGYASRMRQLEQENRAYRRALNNEKRMHERLAAVLAENERTGGLTRREQMIDYLIGGEAIRSRRKG